MRTCTKCGETKSLEMMTKGDPQKYKDGRRNQCKACTAKRMRAYFKAKPEQYEKNKNIPRQVRPNWKRHNISLIEYNQLLLVHNGKCHICKIKTAEVIDHDHTCCSVGSWSCGKCVRGLLCRDCNFMLGNARDSLDTLASAVLYLSTRS